jgi:hypothetical protein
MRTAISRARLADLASRRFARLVHAISNMRATATARIRIEFFE